MRIVLLPAAQAATEILVNTRFRGTGCLLGHRFGAFFLISEILPLPLRGRETARICRTARKTYREKFMGALFSNCPVPSTDDFLENVIMKISAGRIRFSLFQIDLRSGKRIFRPLKRERRPHAGILDR